MLLRYQLLVQLQFQALSLCVAVPSIRDFPELRHLTLQFFPNYNDIAVSPMAPVPEAYFPSLDKCFSGDVQLLYELIRFKLNP